MRKDCVGYTFIGWMLRFMVWDIYVLGLKIQEKTSFVSLSGGWRDQETKEEIKG